MHTVETSETYTAVPAAKGRGIAALCFLAAVILAGALLLTHLSARPITSVRIAGEFVNVSRGKMQQLLDDFLPSGFFELDVEAVRREAGKIPWVRQVSVRRMWPDSLHVAVVERVAVARWNGVALLEADGSIFVPEDSSSGGDYVDLAGPDGSEATVLKQYELLLPVASALDTGVARVALDDRGSWRIDLDSGLTLRLAQGDPLESLAPYIAALRQILGDRFGDAERIDLRYSNGFAVGWRQKARPEEEQSS